MGTLKIIDAREAWKSEPGDFTPWLSENLDLLGKTLGVDLELICTERSVGGFSLDILARDTSTGHNVAIENQLEQTDHSHLGQLLTYASGIDAKIVIWISTFVRDEHRQAIEWLNENTPSDLAFFAVQIELLKIDNSLPAPNFKIIASPNEWIKNPGTSSNISEKQLLYHNFFTEMVAKIKVEFPGLTNASKVGYDNYFNFKTGRSGLVYALAFKAGNKFGCELYIDTGDKEKNEELFDKLFSQREEIEASLGPLSWERLDHRRACRIARIIEVLSNDEKSIEDIKCWAIKSLREFKNMFGSRINLF